MGKIFSPGKLLLTSEYAVLDGALALAVPTRLGQEFFYNEFQDGKSLVIWEAYHQGTLWMKTEIDYKSKIILSSNVRQPAEFILETLLKVAELSEIKFRNGDSYHLKTNLQFPPDFGLGSSSTLMCNLSEWAQIDAYLLNDLTLGGSGYDIAVAKEKSPVLFQIKNGRRISESIDFNPKFKNELVFVHLNRKQDSREGIHLYRSKAKSAELIRYFSEITNQVLKSDSLHDFSELMTLHEEKLSNFLNIETAKQKFFSDCPAFIKSLGAWGGDFVMTAAFDDYRAYFLEKGFSSIFSGNELISW